jgi:hypothetical protein
MLIINTNGEYCNCPVLQGGEKMCEKLAALAIMEIRL